MPRNELIETEKKLINSTMKKLQKNIKLQQATALFGFVFITLGFFSFYIHSFLGLFVILGGVVIFYSLLKKNQITSDLRELSFNIKEFEKIIDNGDQDESKE